MNEQRLFDPEAVCETCGCFGAFRFDGAVLCAECYEKRGSCCPEFGADDLWRFEDGEAAAPADAKRCEPRRASSG